MQSAPTSSLSERRKQRQSTRSKIDTDQMGSPSKFFKILIIILLVSGNLAVFWYINSTLLRITEITCKTNLQTDCSEPVVAELQSLHGQHILWNSSQQVFDKIFTADPTYLHFTPQPILPNTLAVTAEVSQPSYILSSGDQQFTVNEAGFVMSSVQENVPKFTISFELYQQIVEARRIDDSLHTGFREVVDAYNSLSQNKTVISQIEWVDEYQIIIQFSDGRRALLQRENFYDKLVTVLEIYPLPLEVEWTEIDMRFEKPVLRKL